MTATLVPTGAAHEVRRWVTCYTTDHARGGVTVAHDLSVVVEFWWPWNSHTALEEGYAFQAKAEEAVGLTLGDKALATADVPKSGVTQPVEVAACHTLAAALAGLLQHDRGPQPSLVTVQVGVIQDGQPEPSEVVSVTLRPEVGPDQTPPPQPQGPVPSPAGP